MIAPVVHLRDVFCIHRTDEGDAAALRGTTLDLARGEVLCVLGPSGAGKSTLLRVIAGLQEASAGIVEVLGRDVSRLSGRARAVFRNQHLGFLGQHPDETLPPDLSAGQSVELPLALRGAGDGGRVRQLLGAAGLEDRASARPEELSGGERQRLALCVAIAHRPALLLADEPTGELDDRSAEAMRALISELARSEGTSVLVASHDLASAAMADRTLRIRDGRVSEDLRDGRSSLVVGQGGWLQLPSELLFEAGIGSRARVRRTPDGLLLSGAAPARPLAGRAPASPAELGNPDPSRAPAQVELHELSRGYGQRQLRRVVLDQVAVSFAAGKLTVVTGRSGSGKTTMLRLIAALERPESGWIQIDGQSLAGLDAEQLAALRRKRIGYLPQEPSAVGFLSAEENIVLVLRIRGWDPDEAMERAAVTLARVGLADRAAQRVSRLSAGETQRVALARALASARGLLILDEPTSRLDAVNAGVVADMLAAAATEEGQTVICATHDPEVIRRADETVAL